LKGFNYCGAVFIGITGVIALMFSNVSTACSCVEGNGKPDPRQVKEDVIQALAELDNVVLLRAVSVKNVAEYHQQATLLVVKSWKGKYRVGQRLRSDTPDIGGGDCSTRVRVGSEWIQVVRFEPIVVRGCPGMFRVSRMELRYFDRFSRGSSRRRSDKAAG
jgi:hypothetical protein